MKLKELIKQIRTAVVKLQELTGMTEVEAVETVMFALKNSKQNLHVTKEPLTERNKPRKIRKALESLGLEPNEINDLLKKVKG